MLPHIILLLFIVIPGVTWDPEFNLFLIKNLYRTNMGYVYILTNKQNGTLYIGVTSDLIQRVYQHKNDLTDGFSKKYSAHILVYYEQYQDMISAIKREKQLKWWERKWKLALIEKNNPYWNDLYEQIL